MICNVLNVTHAVVSHELFLWTTCPLNVLCSCAHGLLSSFVTEKRGESNTDSYTVLYKTPKTGAHKAMYAMKHKYYKMMIT